MLSAQGAEGQTRLTISDAVREAVENNLQLHAERYQLSLAEAQMVTARLRPNPVLSLESDHLDPWTGLSDRAGVGPAEYAIRTDFLLERGDKRAHRMEAARHELEIAQLQLLDRIRSLTFEVQSVAVDVLAAKNNLALARENLVAFEEIVNINQIRFVSGDIAQVELVRTQLASLQMRNAVRRHEIELRNALERLRLLLGHTGPSGGLDVVDDFRNHEFPMQIEGVRELALERRPDYRVARQMQARSLAEVRLQLATRRLDYSIGTEFRRLHQTGNSFGVFISVPIPLFDRNQGELLRARTEQSQAEASLRMVRAEIETEIHTAYTDFNLARELLHSIENEMLHQARQVREVMEFSYRRGEASLVEFLDAQMAFNETAEAYNDARAEYARNLYLLESVSGMSVNP
jgi:outer membrane protein, heavy metal efflux system